MSCGNVEGGRIDALRPPGRLETMSKTKIEWTDVVWNPVTGCTKVSEGCQNCYAERMAKRLAGRCGYPEEDPFRVTLHPDRLNEPLKWKKPRRVFVCSMGDLFHEDVPLEFIGKVLCLARSLPEHTFIFLTKRPIRMRSALLAWDMTGKTNGIPSSHLWFGVTCENQKAADERIPILLDTPAAVRFISIEPMLEEIDLNVALPLLDWVIVGGESGPKARPMDPDWVREIRDRCLSAKVPFFFKQWGGVIKKRNGRVLDGRTWDQMPHQ